MTEFDKLWNYNDPAATEVKFKEALATLSPEDNLSEYLQLQTQIARTYGLRGMFTEAHTLLNEVEKKLPAVTGVAHVRYYLERGRAFNSSDKKAEAKEQFVLAKKAGEELKEDAYALDALHMLAIAAPPDEAVRLNEEGVIFAENSSNVEVQNWLGPLYNNLAWCYFDTGQFEKALSIFLRSLQWREKKQHTRGVFIAKWCVGRCLRALDRLDDSLKIQLALLEEMVEKDNPDGYVYEELGELYLLKNEEVYKMYFGFAYNTLSKDTWLAEKEQPRLQRMKELSV